MNVTDKLSKFRRRIELGEGERRGDKMKKSKHRPIFTNDSFTDTLNQFRCYFTYFFLIDYN